MRRKFAELRATMEEDVRALPHDRGAERNVLGAVLLANEALAEAEQDVARDDFLWPAHQVIWQAMIDLQHAGQPIDAVTVMDRLRLAGLLEACGGPAYLTSLTDGLAAYSVALATEVARISARTVKEKAILRRLIMSACELLGLDDDAPKRAMADGTR